VGWYYIARSLTHQGRKLQVLMSTFRLYSAERESENYQTGDKLTRRDDNTVPWSKWRPLYTHNNMCCSCSCSCWCVYLKKKKMRSMSCPHRLDRCGFSDSLEQKINSRLISRQLLRAWRDLEERTTFNIIHHHIRWRFLLNLVTFNLIFLVCVVCDHNQGRQ
jgi:hypothetical protein